MTRDSQMWFWLVLAGLFFTLLYLLAPVLTPFLFAALLAYLGDPLVDRMQVHGFSRTFSVLTVFLLIIVLSLLTLLIVIPLLVQQFGSLLQQLPAILDWLHQHLAPWLQRYLDLDPAYFDLSALREQLMQSLSRIGGLAVELAAAVTHSGAVLLGWLANLLLIPVITFYLLRDWDVLVGHIRDLLPRRIEPVVSRLVHESDEILGQFIRGQLLVMVALGTVYSIGLALVGLEFALLIGMLAGLVSFVPYLGVITGVLSAGLAALFQFQDLVHLLQVLLVFSAGQLLEGMVLTPLLVGDRIGLHPVAVMFALLAGGYLFGFFGILLALPAAAVIMVLLRYSHQRYLQSVYYHAGGENGAE
ncbi:MAG TPA: AI-2E family transporter [Candidatus Competibacteraceae bacterium]|nr:AI-2E family transporter [Candidatus Competibacteraceae bacterium]